jgi:hypothetical protein
MAPTHRVHPVAGYFHFSTALLLALELTLLQPMGAILLVDSDA